MPETTAPATSPAPKPIEESAPRSFHLFFSKLAYGQAEGEAAYELEQLLKRLKEESKIQLRKVGGELTIKIGVTVDVPGTSEIAYRVTRKDPPRRTERTHCWVDDKGHLVDKDPRQAELPLRDVSAPRAKIRDADENATPEKPREV